MSFSIASILVQEDNGGIPMGLKCKTSAGQKIAMMDSHQ
jgi:hypothetical protein